MYQTLLPELAVHVGGGAFTSHPLIASGTALSAVPELELLTDGNGFLFRVVLAFHG